MNAKRLPAQSFVFCPLSFVLELNIQLPIANWHWNWILATLPLWLFFRFLWVGFPRFIRLIGARELDLGLEERLRDNGGVKGGGHGLRDCAAAMGVNVTGKNDAEGAEACINAIRELAKKVDIPAGLRDLNVKEEDFAVLATNALKDACGFTNPIQATHEEIVAIYRAAM